MDYAKLTTAVSLRDAIRNQERVLENCKNSKCEWIQFTFGNGSNRENVCDDETIIDKVRQLLIKENESKLRDLKEDFRKL